jgi:hypothetical protein
MKKLFLFLFLTYSSLNLLGQQPDSTNKQLTQHFISFNPFNILVKQIGISYEYKPGRFGFGITPGYIYNIGDDEGLLRFFIAGFAELGDYGVYKGYFINPQINYYLKKNSPYQHQTYLSLKMVYKHMHLDSSKAYLWDDQNGGNDYNIYRKQVDRLNIFGAFLLVGDKYIKKHYVRDFYCGIGFLLLFHHLIIDGEYMDTSGNDLSNTYQKSTFNPPQKLLFEQLNPAITFGINFGHKE